MQVSVKAAGGADRSTGREQRDSWNSSEDWGERSGNLGQPGENWDSCSALTGSQSFLACRLGTDRRASVSGRVGDPTGLPIADVSITLVETATGIGHPPVETETNGEYPQRRSRPLPVFNPQSLDRNFFGEGFLSLDVKYLPEATLAFS